MPLPLKTNYQFHHLQVQVQHKLHLLCCLRTSWRRINIDINIAYFLRGGTIQGNIWRSLCRHCNVKDFRMDTKLYPLFLVASLQWRFNQLTVELSMICHDVTLMWYDAVIDNNEDKVWFSARYYWYQCTAAKCWAAMIEKVKLQKGKW